MLAWAAAAWTVSLALLVLWFGAYVLTAPGAHGPSAVFAVLWGAMEFQFFATVALVPLVPLMVSWGIAGSAVPRWERSWWAVAVGTGLLAGFAVVVAGPMMESAFARWQLAGFAWVCLLAPRVLCRGLRPGAFGGR